MSYGKSQNSGIPDNVRYNSCSDEPGDLFYYDPGKAIQAFITNISVTILTIAMAGVGLSMNLKDTLSTGKKLLPFGIAVWLFQIVAMCILIMLFV